MRGKRHVEVGGRPKFTSGSEVNEGIFGVEWGAVDRVVGGKLKKEGEFKILI